MVIDNKFAKELKREFPILKTKVHGKSIVYLDNCATSQKPVNVINTINEFYAKKNANIHRGVYKLSEDATQAYEEAHGTVGALLNSGDEEIIFTRGTTESINLLSHCLEFKGDIVLTELEHHSNLVPWQQVAKKNNVKLKFIELKEDYTLDYEDAREKISGAGIVSINHVSNALGTVNDIRKLVKLGKSAGAITIVDGAQSVGHQECDVKEIGCDFFAFSGHKMCGPTGIGVLYGRKKLLEEMPPFQFGGDMIRKVTWQDATWNKVPEKFEAGTPNIAGGIGLGEAVKYIKKIGLKNIEKWDKELLSYILVRSKQLKTAKVYSAGIKNSAGIFSFNLNAHAHDVASLLDDDGICIRGGHHCNMPLMQKLGISGTSRASFYFYNTFEDIDRLIDELKKIENKFGGKSAI